MPGEPDCRRTGWCGSSTRTRTTPTYLFRRGDETRPDRTHPLVPGVPEIFGAVLDAAAQCESDCRDQRPLPSSGRRRCDVPPENSTGRRLALAKWLTDPQNPLTARGGGEPHLDAALSARR